MKTVTPEQFGAKADGITNDMHSFQMALNAVSEGGTLRLQADKSYYIAPVANSGIYEFIPSEAAESAHGNQPVAAIDLNDVSNVCIKGENSTILLEKPLFYCNINRTENVTLEGLNFDYRNRPFVKAELIELDQANHSAVMQMDRSLFIDKEEPVYGFGVLQRPDGRYHMGMETIEPVDIEKLVYKINFSNDDATSKRLAMLKTHVLIAPVPGFAHRIERAFSITHNKDFTMRNCKVYSMARFGFALFCNDGIMRFDNLQVRKAPDETVDIAGWRDCFHVKENHAKFIWENCYAEFCYDDIFNISASTMNVNQVMAEDDIDFEWGETHGIYPGVRTGDVMSFFDYDTGRDYGASVIKEIVLQEGSHNRYRFESSISGIKAGKNIMAHVDSMVAPGSEIINCDFRGTFRFRGPIEIINTKFYVARMWLDLFLPFEGPVPKNIHFTDCSFSCDDDIEPYFHVLAQKKTETAEPQYHLEDIVFDNCKLPIATFEIAESDKPYVTFR